MGRFSGRVVRLEGHRDATPFSLLTDNGIQLVNRGQPLLELRSRADRLGKKLIVPGRNVFPGLELNPFGQPLMGVFLWLVTGQFGTSLGLTWAHGSVAWTSQAPANSHDAMTAVAINTTSAVFATASTWAKSPLASPIPPMV